MTKRPRAPARCVLVVNGQVVAEGEAVVGAGDVVAFLGAEAKEKS